MLVVRMALVTVFAVAGFSKLVDRDGTQRAIRAFGFPSVLAPPVAVILPLAEMATALALFAPDTAVAGAVGALVLLGWFIAAIAVNLARGQQVDCHCFGPRHSAPLGWPVLIRNVALGVLAALVIAVGPGPSLGWLQLVTLAVAVVLAGAYVLEGSALMRRR
jgi:hypothetical protein